MKTHIYYRDEIKASIADGHPIAALCGHVQTVAGAPSIPVHGCRRCKRVAAKVRPGVSPQPFRPDATVTLATRGTVTTYTWKWDDDPTPGFIPPAA